MKVSKILKETASKKMANMNVFVMGNLKEKSQH